MVANNLQKKYLLTERSDFKTDSWSGIKLFGIIDGEKCSFYIVKQNYKFTLNLIYSNENKVNKKNKKSDKVTKIFKLKTSKIGLFASLGIYTKKAPQRVHYQKWCSR